MNAQQGQKSSGDQAGTVPPAPQKPATMTLASTGFKYQSVIPQRYSCQGENISPDLSWSSAPSGTKSFALVCEDPDAPHGMFIHWVCWNIPATEHGLSENIARQERHPNGMRQGKNGADKTGYTGPCPPAGKPHRYYFRLFALDTLLDIPADATRDKLMNATLGHVLGKGDLMGTYQRQ